MVGVMAALAAFPAVAGAGSPGRWEDFSGPVGGSDEQTTLLRMADGRLHVVWGQSDRSKADLVHRAIAPNGAVGPSSPIASDFVGVGSAPALVAEGTGLRVFFGGQRSTETGDPVQGILTATSPDGGATWSSPQAITECCSPQGTGGGFVSAVRLGDGTPLVFSSGSGFGIVAHRGLDPATPLINYSDALPGYGTMLYAATARDPRSGITVMAFQATAGPRNGVHAVAVDEASGGPQGSPVAFPGLSDSFVSSSQNTRITARPGGGLFIAHADGERTLLWPVGAPRSVLLGGGAGNHYVASVAPTPDGRVWVIWTLEQAGKVAVIARRSNPQVTRFGERVTIAAPANTQRIYAIDASSQALRLDVVGTVGTFAAGNAAVSQQHTQLLPPLELSASPRSFRGGRTQQVVFTVTDVGVPVAGATVTAAGRSDTSDARGRAVLRLAAPRDGGRIRVTARQPDYRDDRLTLAVRRARRGG
ncbi:MAG TPA: sialidase family protein [Solirubrobacteraceae bacterium]